jgi:cytochrome c-type biogenesis protein CcmH/NrfF
MSKKNINHKSNRFTNVTIIGGVLAVGYVIMYMSFNNKPKQYKPAPVQVKETTQQNNDDQFTAPGKNVSNNKTTYASVSLEEKVLAVARQFRCACGGCGEKQLALCECDMPKGSVEEKNFIRYNLKSGLTVDQVIEMVDKKYGHRNT